MGTYHAELKLNGKTIATGVIEADTARLAASAAFSKWQETILNTAKPDDSITVKLIDENNKAYIETRRGWELGAQ